MAVIIDGTTGITTPGETNTGNLSVAGTTTLTTPLPVASGGTGASSLAGITVGTATNATNATNATTATTATSATTSTNLAGGSNGTIPYQSAAGTTQMLAVGTAGQVLQTNGAGAPTWVTPGGGSWQHITTVTASNSATIDVENAMTAYKMYVIIYTGVIGVTIDANLLCRLKLNGTYVTSDYESRVVISAANSTTYSAETGASTSIIIASAISVDLADGCASGFLYLPNPSLSTVKTVYSIGNGNYRKQADTLGTYGASRTLTGVRFFMSSGNIGSGTFSLYGISNS